MRTCFFVFCPLVLALACSPVPTSYSAVAPELQRLIDLERDYQRQLAVSSPAQRQRITAEYRQNLRRIAPDPTMALRLPSVSQGDRDHLILDGDMLLPRYTFRGAVTVWLLNRQASGISLNEVDAQLAQSAGTAAARGVYKRNVQRWPDGRVPYVFATGITLEEKNWVRQAMAEWESVSNAPAFRELGSVPSSGSYVTIHVENGERSSDTLGLAHVGAQRGGSVRLFRQPIRETAKKLGLSREEVFRATALHELGHTLGLEHEQQRWDRGIFLEGQANDSAALALFTFQPRWEPFRYGDNTFTLPVGVADHTSCTPTVYDYQSIMHYTGPIARQQHQGYQRGETIAFNTTPSAGDKHTIAILYQAGPSCR